MLKLFLDYYNLTIYCATFIVLWIIHYLSIFIMEKRYLEQQQDYNMMSTDLKETIKAKEVSKSIELEEYESAQNSNTELDIEQLHTRSNRITKNMHDLAVSKQKLYDDKKLECRERLEKLILKILKTE